MMRNIGRIPIALLNVAACAHRPPPPEAQPSAGLEALAEQVTIHRDDYGVPHVHGETDAAAVFGYMYAQAADALGEVEREVAEMTGRLARARRRGGRLVGSYVRAWETERLSREEYECASPFLRGMAEAWAAGLNHAEPPLA